MFIDFMICLCELWDVSCDHNFITLNGYSLIDDHIHDRYVSNEVVIFRILCSIRFFSPGFSSSNYSK